jgi:uncharacterized glyoxalase superfamily protein PhnB
MFDCESASTARSFNLLAAQLWFPKAIREVRTRTGHSLMVRVEAIDAHLSRARRHGAEIVQNLENSPYGERQYTCLDPAGHRWTFSETIANVDPAEWGGELAAGWRI